MSLSPALFDPIVVTEVKSYLIEQPSARLTGNPWYMLVSVTLVPVSYTHLTLPTKRIV